MPTHSETKRLPYTADQMYALVADVAEYPQFLPWCAAARVRRETARENGSVLMEADLVISFKVFRERFGSRVELRRDEQRIVTEYIDGPFKYLRSVWLFQPDEKGCLVSFSVTFEFRNALLQNAIGLVFNQAMQRVVAAFERRAAALYG